ncbi:MAG: ComF family protein [Clostridia bacterium]|nr:ComF family protein [Clostridia bacterium]
MVNFILSLLFPPKCPYCSKNISRNLAECPVCKAQFPKYPQIKTIPSGEICIAPFFYDTSVRSAIINYKFKGRKFNAKSLALAVSKTVEDIYKDMDFEVVSCVPLSAERLRERGFNQSEIIAEKVAEHFKKPYQQLLRKTKNNSEQHSLSAKEREKNVIGVYSVIDEQKVSGKKILLIDDVATTGNTLSECCRTLRNSGAERILCATAAIAQ